jgi:hypothetical protein
MAVQINNDGASLKIINGTQVRNIVKNQIREISVVKTNIIKIDIGKGALYNVFIPYADVTFPVAADPESLKEAINGMLSSTGTTGAATEANQLDQTAKIVALTDAVNNIKTSMNSLDSKTFFDPVLVDESNPQVIYKGFANPAALLTDPVWAIQRVSVNGDVCSYQWADGNKNFDNIWNNRTALVYS